MLRYGIGLGNAAHKVLELRQQGIEQRDTTILPGFLDSGAEQGDFRNAVRAAGAFT